MPLTAEQGRVIGCLIEKAATTPDSYPLTTNALRNACNQSTSRDPIVDFSERQVDACMLELRELKLARTVSGSGHRVGKHKHVVGEALGIDGPQLAVLAVLVLRGPQTLSEIITRTERYADGPAGDPSAVEAAIDALAGRVDPLVVRLDRRPGEREPRIDQLWVAPDAAEATARVRSADEPAEPPTAPLPASTDGTGDRGGLDARVTALEKALAEQTRRIDDLLTRLGE
ncbi:MAG: DUF480 domain-containing protein [Acidimicrobiales bacterium]